MSKKTTPIAAAVPEPMAYIGPTINGVAKHGTVYEGGIPKALQEVAK
jgi:hypothetical protein